MQKEFYNFRKNKNDIIAEVDEKNYENEERKDDESEEGDVDDYSDEMRKKNKFNKNNILETEVNNEEDRKNTSFIIFFPFFKNRIFFIF